MMILPGIVAAAVLVVATVVSARIALSTGRRSWLLLALLLAVVATHAITAVAEYLYGRGGGASWRASDLVAVVTSGIALIAMAWLGVMSVTRRAGVRKNEALAMLARELSEAKDLREVTVSGYPGLSSLLPVDRFVLSMIDTDREAAQETYAWDASEGDPAPGRGALDPALAKQFRTSLLRGRSVVVPKLAELSGDSAWESGARSVPFESALVVPLADENLSVGMVCFLSCEPGAYDVAQIELARQIAGLYSGPVARYKQRRELEIRSREAAALAEIGRAVGDDIGPETLLSDVADSLRKIIPYDRMSVSTTGGRMSGLSTVYYRGVTVPEQDDRVDWEPHAIHLREVIGRRRSLVYGESTAELHTGQGFDFPGYRSVGLRSGLIVPMTAGGMVTGIIVLASRLPEAYSINDRRTLERAAAQIAPVVAASGSPANSGLHN